MEMDLEPGFPPDLWNLQAPHKPEALHQMFVDAGSDIILTNTFGANAPRLKLHNAENDTHAINKAGAEIAGKVAAASDRPVVVAGSVGPTGELFEPMGLMTMDSAREEFEIQAACEAAEEVGIPYVFTASFDTAGKTMMGLAPGNMLSVVALLPHPPVAYGANCGVARLSSAKPIAAYPS